MVANDDLEGKTTHFTFFETRTISEPKISKPPIVAQKIFKISSFYIVMASYIYKVTDRLEGDAY